jgi:hypothetical protein
MLNIENPPNILKNLGLDNSRKRKADSLIDCHHCKVHVSGHSRGCDARDVEGDRHVKLEEYCNWSLTQVVSPSSESFIRPIGARHSVRNDRLNLCFWPALGSVEQAF